MILYVLFVFWGMQAGETPATTSVKKDIDLAMAFVNEDETTILQSLSQGHSINMPITDEFNPLIGAIWRKSLSFMKFLVEHGIDINFKAKKGKHALTVCATSTYFDPEIFRYLVNLPGIDINTCTDRGVTALHLLSLTTQDRSDCIELLLQKGADVLARDQHNKIPLVYALAYGNKKHCALLSRPLFEAIKNNNFDDIKRTAKIINLLTIKDEKGNNLLHCAMIYGTEEMVGSLLAVNPNLLTETNNEGETPLQSGVTRHALINKIQACLK